MKTIWKIALAVAGLAVVLAGCGGGGGGGATPVTYSLWIASPSSSGTYQTDNPTVNLGGGSFVPQGALCTGIVGTMPGGYQVNWSNSTTGASGSGSFYLGCFLQVNVIWSAYSIPLVVGDNTITVTATDSAGNIANDTILLSRLPDTTSPTVVSTYPVDGATGIPPNTSVVVTFSEDMDSTTLNASTLRIEDGMGNPVLIQVYYDANNLKAMMIPLPGLAYGTTYTAIVSTGAKDAVGNGLAGDYNFSFTTSANPDTTPPTVESVSPADGSNCAPSYAPVTATFTEAIDPATLDTGSFRLTAPGNSPVAGTVSLNNRTAAFTPAGPLGIATTYVADLSGGIADLAGNSLAAPYSWSFSTAADTGSGSWIPTSVTGVPDARRGHVAVWDGNEMIIAGGQSNQYGRYNPSTETWTVASSGPAVSGSQAVWTGSRMLMWGPVLGYVFDPLAGTWANLPSAGQPGQRHDYTAVWTGTELIIWGGRSSDYATEYGDGARYNPATSTWQPISMAGAPGPRFGHTAVWTGNEMIVWGGGAGGLTQGNGARYNPTTDTWTTMSTTGAPVLSGHVAAWTGSSMVVWGSLTGAGGIYDPNADSWTATDKTCAPSGRLGATAIWTGTRMIVWGGWANNFYFGDGYEFDPVGNSWTKLSNVTAPSARFDHTAVWTGTQMIIWAGSDGADLNTGGVLMP